MKNVILLLLTVILLENFLFGQQINTPASRPIDYEYLSAPDSAGNRTMLKMPLTERSTQVMKLPYPIIFIHGLNSECSTWDGTTLWMDDQYGVTYGGRFDYCLNYDDNQYIANKDFYPTINADIAVFTGTWFVADYYYVNFDVGIDGSYHPNGSTYDVLSNQAAITKQGMALRDAINRVLQLTGRDKVILMGHSMGGLASREYLQNPSLWQPDGQSHVAKLVTTGTPHGGSNAITGGLVDCQGEAYRDLRTTYSGSGSNGVYLFGGLESTAVLDLSSCSGFYNIDVNCNSSIGNSITGLNSKNIDTATVDYSCIIGECTTCGAGVELPGDGIVNNLKANINNHCPNCYTSTSVTNNLFYYRSSALVEIHTDLPNQYYQNMQGLDEPNEFNLAYGIDFDTSYTAFTTIQPSGGYPYDYDDYKFTVPTISNVTVTVNNIALADLMVRFVSSFGTTVGIVQHSSGSANITFTQALDAGSYYLEIFGTPTTSSYLSPHNFVLNRVSTVGIETYEELTEAKIYPNPFENSTTISFSNEQKNTKIKLVDILGNEVKSMTFSGKHLLIEKGEMHAGIYFLQIIKDNEHILSRKIIIQ